MYLPARIDQSHQESDSIIRLFFDQSFTVTGFITFSIFFSIAGVTSMS